MFSGLLETPFHTRNARPGKKKKKRKEKKEKIKLVQLLYQNAQQRNFDVGSSHSLSPPLVDGSIGNLGKILDLLVAQICFSLSFCRY